MFEILWLLSYDPKVPLASTVDHVAQRVFLLS